MRDDDATHGELRRRSNEAAAARSRRSPGADFFTTSESLRYASTCTPFQNAMRPAISFAAPFGAG